MEEGVQGALQAGEMLVEGGDAPHGLRSWHFWAISGPSLALQVHRPVIQVSRPLQIDRQAAHCPAEVTGWAPTPRVPSWHPGRLQKGLVRSSEPRRDGGRPHGVWCAASIPAKTHPA